jgi:hypothetical protein
MLTLFPSVTVYTLATHALKRAVFALSDMYTMDPMCDHPLSNVNCWTMVQPLPRPPYSQSMFSHQLSRQVWLALTRQQTHRSPQCLFALLRPIIRLLSQVRSPSARNLCQLTTGKILWCLKIVHVSALREWELLSDPRKRLSFTTSLGY